MSLSFFLGLLVTFRSYPEVATSKRFTFSQPQTLIEAQSLAEPLNRHFWVTAVNARVHFCCLFMPLLKSSAAGDAPPPQSRSNSFCLPKKIKVPLFLKFSHLLIHLRLILKNQSLQINPLPGQNPLPKVSFRFLPSCQPENIHADHKTSAKTAHCPPITCLLRNPNMWR